jgi:hypothetical protein
MWRYKAVARDGILSSRYLISPTFLVWILAALISKVRRLLARSFGEHYSTARSASRRRAFLDRPSGASAFWSAAHGCVPEPRAASGRFSCRAQPFGCITLKCAASRHFFWEFAGLGRFAGERPTSGDWPLVWLSGDGSAKESLSTPLIST